MNNQDDDVAIAIGLMASALERLNRSTSTRAAALLRQAVDAARNGAVAQGVDAETAALVAGIPLVSA